MNLACACSESFLVFVRIGGTVDDLVLTGHGHLTERKTLAFFGDSVIPCRHSGEKPFQRG